MDLKQLETFVHVAELGSFTRAATVLRVAQPALSRQVRALEVELRQALFERNGRGVTLTEPGRRLLAHGRGILQQVARAKLDLSDRDAAGGHLAVGLPPSLSRTHTGALVGAFRERFPKATLTVVEGLSTYAMEWLALGRIDCALVYNVSPTAAIDLQPVGDESLYLISARPTRAADAAVAVASATVPVRLARLIDHELVMPSRPHSIRMLLETTLAAGGLKPHIALEIDSVPAILDIVARQSLHAVLARNALRGREREFIAQPIVVGRAQLPLAVRLWIATSALRPRGHLIEQGSALLLELLKGSVDDAQMPPARRRG
ncbi:MAG TPA: LysR substrate-binding domain-containing protein [Methylibium sp.]|uniref:LysR family transcriptional regulator n=1 Tax=Methylibium sp. TaxID=2067992 RepID=UPI002DBD168C|nr:LysR substrate-binding domain-containing protein [Methylibium sp.]HEU4460175.1 LysR substrate-binding domain-containing protein [Methylibium sp.]